MAADNAMAPFSAPSNATTGGAGLGLLAEKLV